MKRAALAVVLAACSSSINDFPALTEGAPPGGTSGTGGTGGARDGGLGDGGDGGAGRVISARVCIVRDLSNPTDCDTKDASGVTVTLGTRPPLTGPDATGNFTIVAPSGTPVWHLSGKTFVSSVMLFGTDTLPLLPIVPDTLYSDAQGGSGVQVLAEGQGSVLARVVSSGTPVANVQAATTFTSTTNTIPLYPTKNLLTWVATGPTLASGTVWLPGIDVTSVPGQISFTLPGKAPVVTTVSNVEDQAITFVTQDLQ